MDKTEIYTYNSTELTVESTFGSSLIKDIIKKYIVDMKHIDPREKEVSSFCKKN